MNIYPPSISKQNLIHENQIVLLMIPDGEGWYYLSVKKSSYEEQRQYMLMTLIVWIVFIPLKQKTSKLESHKKGWGKRYFCDVVMSS